MASSVSHQSADKVLPRPDERKLSILHGPTDPPLVNLTLGELLNLQSLHHGTRECLVIPWTGARWTYNELNRQSSLLAAALLDMGIAAGDRVGIMAGNCEQYAAVLFAVTRIGAILVILNNTYTPAEARYGLAFSGRSPRCSRSRSLVAAALTRVTQNARSSSPPSRLDDSTTGRC